VFTQDLAMLKKISLESMAQRRRLIKGEDGMLDVKGFQENVLFLVMMTTREI
jgi:hypothetical protein